MTKKNLFILTVLVAVVITSSFYWGVEDIPKTWDMKAIKRFHLPPPDSTVKVVYASEEYYNSLPEHVIYKTFPVYVREFEPKGYLDSLRNLEPEIMFDVSKLKTQADWIKAGELVFNWPVASYRKIEDKVSHITSAAFKNNRGKYSKEGLYPANRYIIAEKGKIQLGSLSCASCHTRVMENGEMVAGAQGNVFSLTGFANDIESGKIPYQAIQQENHRLSFVPWMAQDTKHTAVSKEEFVKYLRNLPLGTSDRSGMAFLYPLTIPSLIGLKDIKYLDHTGLMRHESAGDLMRYAAFNQNMDMTTSYNGYIPIGKNENSELPPVQEWNHPFGYVGKKYSDAQLYALTQYIYSLKPPKNPNKFSKKLIEKGAMIFAKVGCVSCHTPPIYTNNKLTPANGFEPPKNHFKTYDIFNVSVETDSVSTLYTRRGTGYYKVPSLRGVWYQGVFFHNGSLTSLEEVLDPKRLQADYVPTGYKPPHLKTMAVKGHSFGLDLSEADKKALIAFMKTL
jgi:ferredoxin-like protein FixX